MTTQLESTDNVVERKTESLSLRAMMKDILSPILDSGIRNVDGVRVFTYQEQEFTARSLTDRLRSQYPVLREFERISVLTEVNRAARRAFGATRVQPPRKGVKKGDNSVRGLARAELKKRIGTLSLDELAKLAK